MKEYELAVVLHPDLEIDLKGASSRLEKLIEQIDGKIVKKDEWGKQRLAYAINNQVFGVYVIYQLELNPAKVGELEQGLLLSEEVLRHLLLIPLPETPESEEKVVADKPAATDNKTTKAKAKVE